jgi:hypothetical protein
MRHLILAAAVSGTALVAGYGAATAQVVIDTPAGGVYVGPSYDRYEYGPRPYGYYRDYRYYGDNYHERRADRDRCGRYSYWDGNACQPGRRP